MGARKVECKTDSQLTVSHISGEYQVKDPLLLKYYHRVVGIMIGFEGVSIHHIKREYNSQADILSKLPSSKLKGQHDTIIHQTLSTPPLVVIEECMTINQEGTYWILRSRVCWRLGSREGIPRPHDGKESFSFCLSG